MEPYLRRLAERGWPGGEPPQESLRQAVVDVAAKLYRDQASPPVELLEFSDGAFDVLFDAAHELTILMHGLSQSTPPNSRDRNYHRGFPGRAGFDSLTPPATHSVSSSGATARPEPASASAAAGVAACPARHERG
jgi:hypothetical protein